MRYFYDTEFIEDGKVIDLISIGIVAEDEREMYAQCTEYLDSYRPLNGNQREFPQWIKDNVLPSLQAFHVSKQIIKDYILEFMDIKKYGCPELWGWFSAYDHVAFCQIFGRMIDLPEGFPMYTHDIRQLYREDQVIYPQNENEHNALADARWNKRLYEVLVQKGK